MHRENSLTQLLLADFICRHSTSVMFRRVSRHSKMPGPACAIVVPPDGIVLNICDILGAFPGLDLHDITVGYGGQV
jgi:hypothetical protein